MSGITWFNTINLENDIEEMIFQWSINDVKKCQEHIISLAENKIRQQKIWFNHINQVQKSICSVFAKQNRYFW